MRTLLRNTAIALVVAASLSGCFRMEASYTLHSDDTVDGTVLMAVQKGIGDSMGMTEEDLLDQLQAEGGPEGIDGATVEPFEDEDWVGQTISFAAQPLASLSEEDTGAGISREGDEFVFQGDPLGEDSGDPSMMPGAQFSMSVTFPGEVIEHNGTVEGTTVTWDLLTLDEPMYARGRATEGLVIPSWAWYAAGGTLVVGGAAIAAVIVARRRSAHAAPSAVAIAPADAAGGAAPLEHCPQRFEPEPPPAQPYTPPTPSESWPAPDAVPDAPEGPAAPGEAAPRQEPWEQPRS